MPELFSPYGYAACLLFMMAVAVFSDRLFQKEALAVEMPRRAVFQTGPISSSAVCNRRSLGLNYCCVFVRHATASCCSS